MATCGKPYKFVGKLSSKNCLYCGKEENHLGDHGSPEEANSSIDQKREPSKVRTIIVPSAQWPFPINRQPAGAANDPSPDIPDGVVIQ